MNVQRRWWSLLVGGGVLAAVLFMLVPTASSAPGDVYTATISPTTMTAGTTGASSTYSVTISSDVASPDTIGAVQVILDSAYGNVTNASVTSPASGWNQIGRAHV